MRLKLHWHHWFWVTFLTLLSVTGYVNSESFLVENKFQDDIFQDNSGLPVVGGARGGRLVRIPDVVTNQQNTNNNVQVTQSVSMSKVSVKRGHVSMDHEDVTPEKELHDHQGVEDLAAHDDLYQEAQYQEFYDNYYDNDATNTAGGYDVMYNYDQGVEDLSQIGREMTSGAEYYYYDDDNKYASSYQNDHDNQVRISENSYNQKMVIPSNNNNNNGYHQDLPATANRFRGAMSSPNIDHVDNTDGLLAPFGIGFGPGYPPVLDGVGLILNNRVARPPPPPVVTRHREYRRLDPIAAISPSMVGKTAPSSYSGYNLVYIDPAKPSLMAGAATPAPPVPPRPQYSFLTSLLSKLKALALATQASIRMSNSMRTGNGKAPLPVKTIPMAGGPVMDATLSDETDFSEDKHVQFNQLSSKQDQDVSEVVRTDVDRNSSWSGHDRSAYARGRSLPLSALPAEQPAQFLTGKDRETYRESDSPVSIGVELVQMEEGDSEINNKQHMELDLVQEIVNEQNENGEPAVVEVIESVEPHEDESLPEILLEEAEEIIAQENNDLSQEVNGKEKLVVEDGDEYRVRMLEVEGGISYIVGIALGIFIFVIITAVLLLLAVWRKRRNIKKIPDDTLSQSSYTSSSSCSTTLSDQSVNYGPAWDKDVGQEDLYSLDNDSFLNSLEAVTAEYWVDKK